MLHPEAAHTPTNAVADSVSMAALVLLERLSPLEHAVFVLREVFAFDFDEAAAAVGHSEAACRQLLVRARRHMQAGRVRFESDRQERQELARRFFDALTGGDVGGLQDLLAAGVQLVGTTEARPRSWPRPPWARRMWPGCWARRLRCGRGSDPRIGSGRSLSCR